MAKFVWVGQKNHIEPEREDSVIEFRANLRGTGFTSHFPLNPEGFVAGESLRAPGVVDPNIATPFKFTDEDYRLRHLLADPRIRAV